MAGAVIENVSSKKLYIGAGLIFLVAIGGFLLGAVYVQSEPHIASTNIATECVVQNDTQYYMPWHPNGAPVLPNQQCVHAEDIKSMLQPHQVIHALHIPKNTESLSRWWSYLLILIYPTLEFVPEIQDGYGHGKPTDDKIYFEAKIFYRNDLSEPWKLSYEANFSRNYQCEGSGVEYECQPMHFVELGSVPHKYYLINFKLPMFVGDDHRPSNQYIGRIEHMNMPGIIMRVFVG